MGKRADLPEVRVLVPFTVTLNGRSGRLTTVVGFAAGARKDRNLASRRDEKAHLLVFFDSAEAPSHDTDGIVVTIIVIN